MATPKTGYIPYIDGARGIAIAFVVLSHAGLGKIIPGKFGVTLFFFLSGYLITRLLLAEMQEKGRIDFGSFYLRRLFRLYPALLVMIGFSVIAAKIMAYPLPMTDVWASLFYYTNYYIGWFRTPVEDPGRILDILWSLSVEEHFYLAFPLLLQFFIQNKINKTSVKDILKSNTENPSNLDLTHLKLFSWFLLALCIASLGIRWFTYEQFYPAVEDAAGRIYFSTHTRLDSIIWGCLAALLLFGLESRQYIAQLKKNWVFAIGILFILLSFAIRNDLFRQTWLYSFQGMGLFLTIPAIGLFKNPLLKNLLSHPAMIFVGKISYSLYLFHWIVSKLGNHYFVEWSWQWQLFFWPLTLLLSIGSYYLIEQPFVGLRKKYGSKA